MLAKHERDIQMRIYGTRHTIHQAFIQESFNYSIVYGEPTKKVCAHRFCVCVCAAVWSELDFGIANGHWARLGKRTDEQSATVCTVIRPETNASPDHKQKT